MEGGPWTFVDIIPDYEIRGGLMYITAPGWGMCMPLGTFCAGHKKSRRIIADYLQRTAEIVPINRQSG